MPSPIADAVDVDQFQAAAAEVAGDAVGLDESREMTPSAE